MEGIKYNQIGVGTTVQSGAIIESGAVVGENCFIGYHTIIRPGVIIGDGTEIRANCFVAEGACIGDDVKIIQFSNICKRAIVENKVFIGPGVIMVDTYKISWQRPYDPIGQAPILRYGCRIGGGTVIMPGVVVGKNAVVGAGSLVLRHVQEETKVVGNPAKLIGTVDPSELL